MRVVISGFGTVGRSLVELMLERGALRRLSVVAVVDSRGAALSERGLSERALRELLRAPRGGVSSHPEHGQPGVGTVSVLREVEADALVELTPSDYNSGEPGLGHTLEAIERGVDVVLANKSPIALMGLELLERARERGVRVLYRATVMGGTPLVPLVSSLRGSVRRIYGVLNATTNYVLTLVHELGLPFADALRRAQGEGVAEADPSLDVDGLDPAAKLAILACTLGVDMRVGDVERESLRSAPLEEAAERRRAGLVPKYVARLELSDGGARASVRLEYVRADDPLAGVRGLYNGVYVETGENRIFISGLGAGGRPTAEAVLEDLLSLAGWWP